MASLETIGPLMNGMRKRADTVGLACEAINRMFQKEQSELVAQVSDSEQFRGGQVCCAGGLRALWVLLTNFLSFFFLHSLLASL